MKNLILLRGLPGSGKSTLSQLFSAFTLESDMYFIQDRKYNFDATKLKEAHQWCQDQCKSYMQREKPKIVISNTFTQEWEMKPYIDLANQHGYTIFTIVVENRHGNSSVHNVPEETINKMKNRFEIKI